MVVEVVEIVAARAKLLCQRVAGGCFVFSTAGRNNAAGQLQRWPANKVERELLQCELGCPARKAVMAGLG